MRGIAFVQAPTTLLAQVDASVGGKVVVNHPRAKNVVGAFHQPRAVLSDLDTLQSLSRRDLAAGMAEVIKHGAIADAHLFQFTRDAAEDLLRGERWGLQYAVHRSCELKGWFVEVDEFDRGPRALLNFGHTIGHGLEQATGFRRLRHGEAVALGMIAEARLGEKLGITEDGCAGALRETVAAYGLPTALPDVDPGLVLSACVHDKKAVSGRLQFALIDRIGAGRTRVEAPEDVVASSLSSILAPCDPC
jgi:3-dehydroquinate synthase